MHIRNSARRAAAALLLASCGAAPAAEPAPADDVCNFHMSMPLLERGVYRSHTYTERKDDNATETAELAAGVRIEIVSSGCVDSSSRTYTLTYSGTAAPERTLAQWAGLAQRELDGLRYLEGAKDQVRETVAFAGSVAAAERTGNKFIRCADDSVPPDGECSWNTGGTRAIEVRRAPGAVRVILMESSSR
jgi:hypothetical protein